MQAWEAVIKWGNITGSYGYIHIRRKDRISGNEMCTSVDRIEREVTSMSSFIKNWIIHFWAEDEYLIKLKSRLRLVRNTRFFFEDEIDTQLYTNGDDNALKLAINVAYTHPQTAVVIETWKCKGLAPAPVCLNAGAHKKCLDATKCYCTVGFRNW